MGASVNPPGGGGEGGGPGPAGPAGKSAYEIAVDEGFVGDEAAWLASLVGPAGVDGANGADGVDGEDGTDGSGIWEVISDQVLSAPSASILFTGLSSYKEIEIRWAGRSNAGGDRSVDLLCRFNSDTGSNYGRSWLYRSEAFLSQGDSLGQTAGTIGRTAGEQSTQEGWGDGVITFRTSPPSGRRKSVRGTFQCVDSVSRALQVGNAAGSWYNTTDPISTMELLLSSGSWIAASEFTVLGRH